MAAGETPHDAPNALRTGQRLHEFELRDVIGVGGFGIVYRAVDLTLEREVAIKEYMPASLAGRSQNNHVSLLSQAHAETFALGLQSFVNEAKLLARFDHPALVKVLRFWEEHGTAYMAMPLYRGRTLRQLRQSMSQAPDDGWIRQLLERLLGALEVMHREGVYHRDIAPDNILVTDEGLPVLLDFGAARRVISDRNQTLTAILKPNFAPIEQYAESTGLRQGPWTDFYALGATLFFLITGKPPLSATARMVSDDQPRLRGSGQGGLSETLLHLCDWMLAPRPQDRPQNAAEVRAALSGQLPMPARAEVAQDSVWQATVAQTQASDYEPLSAWTDLAATPPDIDAAPTLGRLRRVALPASAALMALAIVIAGVLALWLSAPEPKVEAASTSAPTATPRKPVMPAAAPSRKGGDAPVPLTPAAQVPAVAPPTLADAGRIEPRNPHEHCGGRLLIALHRCLVRECEKAEHQGHRACQKVRQVEERQRRVVGAQGYGA
jgi:serine/threonine protein kinase